MRLERPTRYNEKEGGLWFPWLCGKVDLDELEHHTPWSNVQVNGIQVHALDFNGRVWDSLNHWRDLLKLIRSRGKSFYFGNGGEGALTNNRLQIQGIKADTIIFDDIIKENQMSEGNGVTVFGEDIRDVKRKVFDQTDQWPWLSIQPGKQQDYSRDREIPNESFIVKYNSKGESFRKEVKSVKELFELIKPLADQFHTDVVAHERAVKAAEVNARKELLQVARRHLFEAKERVKFLEKAGRAAS